MPDAVILANGTPPSREALERVLRGSSLFVCADGGADVARRYGLTPHAIVGDIDSVSPDTLAHFRSATLVRDTDQESTDAEKALGWVLKQGAFELVTILGATAGRLDHVLGHLSLLRRYRDRTRLILEHDDVRAWLARGNVRIEEPPGTVVSFFAVGAAAEGVTTENLRYPLRERRLELGTQDSISNVVEASPATVRIARGELLVIVVRESAGSPGRL